MRLDELDFELPPERIARHPPAVRDAARLMRVRCGSGDREHLSFRNLPELLQPGDLLVLNDTHVEPARMVLRKRTGGTVEGLWLEALDGSTARCMLSGGRLRPGVEVQLGSDDGPWLRLLEREQRGCWKITKQDSADWLSLLDLYGSTPLPPYIRNLRREAGQAEDSAEDRIRYQSLWAAAPGSVAAPTASLHFTPEVLSALRDRGVEWTHLTLHVGLGTFLPVEVDDVADHPIHTERYALSAATAAALRSCRDRGGRVVAIGSTVCRVLESLPDAPVASSGETDLFLLPGYRFRWTDVLLTNFHTPRSTLLAMVAAFAEHAGGPGLELVKDCYREAISKEYRFYSYGDASIWMP